MCCKYTLSPSPLSTACLSFYRSPLSLYISPVSHTVCYYITVTYILFKKSLPVFSTCVEMQSLNYQYLGKKKSTNNNDVVMETNLACKYLYEERFPSFSFLFLLYSFWVFLGLRDFLSSASQCATVSVYSSQCLSVCQSRSPCPQFHTCFLIFVQCSSFIHFFLRHHFPPCFVLPLALQH